MEQQLASGPREWRVSEFIEDDEVEPHVMFRKPACPSSTGSSLFTRSTSIKTWKKMRNSVAHGELVSPHSSEEQDGTLLALARLFHDLTKEDVRRVLAGK